MDSLPQDLVALGVLVFVLGLKHGFDADHLATIDGLTRFNSRTQPRLACFCGALFSLGHGCVVIVIALAVATLARHWQTPEWMNVTGAWISIGVLAALGWLNIRAVLRANPNEIVQPIGFKGRFLGRLACAANPVLIALVGALFALSFDTISQAALFAVTASRIGGWQHALMLGFVFMVGMLVTDGINGLWISRLIRRADRIAVTAPRIMSLVVGSVSLLIAAFGVIKLLMPVVETWSRGREMSFGAIVVAIMGAGYLFALWLARSRNVALVAGR